MEIIKEDAFRKQLKSGLEGSFLFFGEEDYMKSFSLRAAREAICSDETFAVFNDVSIAPIDYTPAALLDALMPPPMMADKKIVSINGLAISDMKQSEIDDLCEVLATLPDYDYNVLVISVPYGLIDEGNLPKHPSAVFTNLSKYLTPVKFDAVTGARLNVWVQKHFSHHGVSASPEICAKLIDKCGRSMFTLSSETEKLSYYVLQNGRNTVSTDDVDDVAISVIDSDAYALANAILDGRYADAIEALGVMKFRRVEPVIILSEVSRVICELVTIKALLSEGMSNAEISSTLKMNEYKTKLYASAAASRPLERLKRALLLCSEADLSLKLSPQGYTAIEKLICTL
ncbi:MAG: DNA polymerase III subunit delta [Ruminococcaceae bacterium]|nr:DNA polymerase III subunit delta [Oscillospiraceae bacterium]